MANPEHVAILKQGVDVWNKWREDYSNVIPNLSGANLHRVSLSFANLFKADFTGATLLRANLSDADFREATLHRTNIFGANLDRANFCRANLSNADLRGAMLHRANLRGADLQHADLSGATLRRANLSDADLRNTDLSNTDLCNSNLDNASLTDANLRNAMLSGVSLNNTDIRYTVCDHTIFAETDLSTTNGLDTVDHLGPSTVGMDTIFKSKGKIPEIFLRGCGVPETVITFLPSMLEEAIQFYSCFISYSHKDKEFAKRLHDRLQGIGIRCWLDEYQLNPGDKLHSTIYEAIRLYDKVILCCSETALKSWWVEKEFENATTKEQDYAETVLIPITLDNYLFEQAADRWIIGEIREKRVVQSFINWKDHDAFEAAFKKVVDALRTDGGKPPPPESKLTRRKP